MMMMMLMASKGFLNLIDPKSVYLLWLPVLREGQNLVPSPDLIDQYLSFSLYPEKAFDLDLLISALGFKQSL